MFQKFSAFNLLPDEIKEKIFSYLQKNEQGLLHLQPADAARLERVCKDWQKLDPWQHVHLTEISWDNEAELIKDFTTGFDRISGSIFNEDGSLQSARSFESALSANRKYSMDIGMKLRYKFEGLWKKLNCVKSIKIDKLRYFMPDSELEHFWSLFLKLQSEHPRKIQTFSCIFRNLQEWEHFPDLISLISAWNGSLEEITVEDATEECPQDFCELNLHKYIMLFWKEVSKCHKLRKIQLKINFHYNHLYQTRNMSELFTKENDAMKTALWHKRHLELINCMLPTQFQESSISVDTILDIIENLSELPNRQLTLYDPWNMIIPRVTQRNRQLPAVKVLSISTMVSSEALQLLPNLKRTEICVNHKKTITSSLSDIICFLLDYFSEVDDKKRVIEVVHEDLWSSEYGDPEGRKKWMNWLKNYLTREILDKDDNVMFFEVEDGSHEFMKENVSLFLKHFD